MFELFAHSSHDIHHLLHALVLLRATPSAESVPLPSLSEFDVPNCVMSILTRPDQEVKLAFVNRIAHQPHIPSWFERSADKPLRVFLDTQRYHDDIHGRIYHSQIERDIIDTPEFQRLFAVSQMGFISRVFRSANHTRGNHSIGASFVAKCLVDTVNKNSKRIAQEREEKLRYVISFSERVVISLAGLLHDITHAPFSHDVESKKHEILSASGQRVGVIADIGRYPKHDNWHAHPALYVALLNPQISNLARVLQCYSPAFLKLLKAESVENKQFGLTGLLQLVLQLEQKWPSMQFDLLPQLLFHLLIFEKAAEAKSSTMLVTTDFHGKTERWGLGPSDLHDSLHVAWYQPFRHDIIGNTLSADLVDYLLRDRRRLGFGQEIDLTMCDFYALAPVEQSSICHPQGRLFETTNLYRCAIDITDYKRGTIRTDTVNQIFGLLDDRFEIHQKAVTHRITQSLAAMLSRALHCLELEGKRKPSLQSLYGWEDNASPALRGDDWFLNKLEQRYKDHSAFYPGLISLKLAERRVYRPLLIIQGDRLAPCLLAHGLESEDKLRTIAAIVESRMYSRFFLYISWLIEKFLEHAINRQEVPSWLDAAQMEKSRMSARVIISASPYKQLYKDPEILVRYRSVGGGTAADKIVSLEKIENEVGDELSHLVESGLAHSARRYEALWRLHAFVSDGLYYVGPLAKLDPSYAPITATNEHLERLVYSQLFIFAAIKASFLVYMRHYRGNPSELNGNELHEDRVSELFVECQTQLRETDQRLAANISSVKAHEYLHSDADGAESQYIDKCRDVRYKFNLLSREHSKTTAKAKVGGVLDELHSDSEIFTEPDLIRLSNVFEHVPDLQAVLNQAKREEQLSQSARGAPKSSRPFDILRKLWVLHG